MTMTLLRPAPGLCQECGRAHNPEIPHDKNSLYYATKFKMEHGREPSWDDAVAHCTEDMKKRWSDTMNRVRASTEQLQDKEKQDDPTAHTE